MSRSSKKGPFVEERLMSRITAMNDGGRKHGGLPHDDEAAGPGGGCDLVTVVPNWQR